MFGIKMSYKKDKLARIYFDFNFIRINGGGLKGHIFYLKN